MHTKLKDLVTEMEIAQELADDGRINEIKDLKAGLEEELKIMNAVAPHEVGATFVKYTFLVYLMFILILHCIGRCRGCVRGSRLE